jgi:cytochrome oxidase assembly protein ShyY1
MLRGLASPKWIFIHLCLGALTLFMVFLGLWQMNRLELRQELNKSVISRTALPVTPASELLTSDTPPKELEWRRVSLTGTYSASEAITVINRSQNGAAGYNVVVPLYINNNVVLINRGFVPLAMSAPTAPTGQVTVMGYLRATQVRGTLGAIDSSDPGTKEFQRFDIPRIAAGISGEVAPMLVQVIQENPAQPDQWPSVVGLPQLDEGSHLSYAFQWFFFSAVALTGWFVVIRRKWRAGVSDPSALVPTSA